VQKTLPSTARFGQFGENLYSQTTPFSHTRFFFIYLTASWPFPLVTLFLKSSELASHRLIDVCMFVHSVFDKIFEEFRYM